MAKQQQARLGGRVPIVWDPGDRGLVYRSVPVPARQRLHPDFRFLSPKQRFRRRLWLALACLCVVGIGAAMMVPLSPRKSDAAMAPADQVSRAEGNSGRQPHSERRRRSADSQRTRRAGHRREAILP